MPIWHSLSKKLQAAEQYGSLSRNPAEIPDNNTTVTAPCQPWVFCCTENTTFADDRMLVIVFDTPFAYTYIYYACWWLCLTRLLNICWLWHILQYQWYFIIRELIQSAQKYQAEGGASEGNVISFTSMSLSCISKTWSQPTSNFAWHSSQMRMHTRL